MYLQSKLHVSWLIAVCSLGFLLGIAASAYSDLPFSNLQSIMIATVLLAVGLARRNKTAVLLLLLSGIIFGFSRGGSVQQSLEFYQPHYGDRVQVVGKVKEDISFGSRGDVRIQVSEIQIDGVRLPGTVWISSETQREIKRSDIVTVAGVLNEGFGNIPASMFRAELIAVDRPIHGDVAREMRDWFAEGVRRAISEPEASLGIGYLVGQRSTLPEELDNQLKLLGLTHIVVASGYNLTILVRFTRRSMAKHSKYLATMAASFMICGFVLVTGFSPSMSRAALVTGISLLAWYFGRRAHPLVILPFAAAITALLNPLFVWGDIGWYLSFAAFAGVMILAPLLKRLLWRGTQPHSLVQIVLETFAAQLATLPIVAFVFGQYSSLALIANALILPFVPLAMLLTFFAGLAGVLLPGVASLIGWPATVVLNYMTGVADRLAAIPGASMELTFSTVTLVTSYLFLVIMCVLLWRKTKYNFREETIID